MFSAGDKHQAVRLQASRSPPMPAGHGKIKEGLQTGWCALQTRPLVFGCRHGGILISQKQKGYRITQVRSIMFSLL
jgi:hypothetical protein